MAICVIISTEIGEWVELCITFPPVEDFGLECEIQAIVVSKPSFEGPIADNDESLKDFRVVGRLRQRKDEVYLTSRVVHILLKLIN